MLAKDYLLTAPAVKVSAWSLNVARNIPGSSTAFASVPGFLYPKTYFRYYD